MKIEDIYQSAGRLMVDLIRREMRLQGHYLTGHTEQLIGFRTTRYVLMLEAPQYVLDLNEGLTPDQISPSMLKGLVRYFMIRGYDEAEAQRIAKLTYHKWQSEGMSTQASKRFSQTGARQHFIEAAMLSFELEEHLAATFDFAIDEQFNKTKSDTI